MTFGWLNETRLLEWEMEESGARIWAMTLTDEKKMLVKKVASFLIKEKSMWSLKCELKRCDFKKMQKREVNPFHEIWPNVYLR